MKHLNLIRLLACSLVLAGSSAVLASCSNRVISHREESESINSKHMSVSLITHKVNKIKSQTVQLMQKRYVTVNKLNALVNKANDLSMQLGSRQHMIRSINGDPESAWRQKRRLYRAFNGFDNTEAVGSHGYEYRVKLDNHNLNNQITVKYNLIKENKKPVVNADWQDEHKDK